jgi:SAM-dependent methyltransferase
MELGSETSRAVVRAWCGRACPGQEPEYRPFPDVPRRNLFQERVEIALMARLLPLPRGRRVLEVGCGRGVALPALARRLRPSRLAGLDVDRSLLREARERLERTGAAHEVELVHGDVRALPFPDASFDLVIDFGTCYHVARRTRALGEIARVLADGGRFVHETRANQWLAHPVRSRGRRLPWESVPELLPERTRALWGSRLRVARR